MRHKIQPPSRFINKPEIMELLLSTGFIRQGKTIFNKDVTTEKMESGYQLVFFSNNSFTYWAKKDKRGTVISLPALRSEVLILLQKGISETQRNLNNKVRNYDFESNKAPL